MLAKIVCLVLLAQVVQPTRAATNSSGSEPNYADALSLSFLFYEAQQSGQLACWNRRGHWTEDGWRVSSHLNDGKEINADLTGGFYDAGDHLKVTLPLGFAMSTLAWGGIEYKEVYVAKGQYEILRRNVGWGLDWLMKAHYKASDNPDDNAIVAQVGDPGTDHKYWWKPSDEPEGFCRSVLVVDKKHKAADVAGSAAAALAAGAVLFQDQADYSAKLLKHAKQLYGFAAKHGGVWKVRRGETIYNSTTYEDDVAWAAAWLCKATNDAKTCDNAVKAWNKALPKHRYLINSDWENVFIQATVLMLTMEQGGNNQMTEYRKVLANKMIQWMNTGNTCTEDAKIFRGCYSPKGVLYMTKWGNMPRVANANLAALIYSNYMSSAGLQRNYRCWARSQLRMMLGDWGRSFLIGFGDNNPTHVHHRSASCPQAACKPCTSPPYSIGDFESANQANPNVLKGALLGGPDNVDKYEDVISNYPQNEPALDSNSGFTSAMAAMATLNARLGSLTWSLYCDPETLYEKDPLAKEPKFTTQTVIASPLEAAVAAQCKLSTQGPAPKCTASTQASISSTACTPQLDSAAQHGAAPLAKWTMLWAVAAALLLVVGV